MISVWNEYSISIYQCLVLCLCCTPWWLRGKLQKNYMHIVLQVLLLQLLHKSWPDYFTIPYIQASVAAFGTSTINIEILNIKAGTIKIKKPLAYTKTLQMALHTDETITYAAEYTIAVNIIFSIVMPTVCIIIHTSLYLSRASIA